MCRCDDDGVGAQIVGEAVHGGDEVRRGEGPEVEEVGGPDGKDVGFFVGGVDGDDGGAGDSCVLEGGLGWLWLADRREKERWEQEGKKGEMERWEGIQRT